jgi:hypothetical protein
MATVGLLSCASRKRSEPCKASELYDSSLFRKAREFVQKHCDCWYILSAKYGLVEPARVIGPYQETLNAKSRSERQSWAQKVLAELRPRLRAGDRVIVLAGQRYREFLVSALLQHGCDVQVPLEGMRIGRQLQWLSRRAADDTIA